MRALLLGLAILSSVGCASFGKKLKAFLGGKDPSQVAVESAQPTGAQYSESPNLYPGVRRSYKRVTRQSLQDEAFLENRSGSLWVMEGQGAYLFSQNIMRMIGDPIAVTIEGEPREQLGSKVDVIKTLWAKFEEKMRVRNPASNDKAQSEAAKEPGKDPLAAQASEKAQGSQPPVPADFSVRNVPTRIVERTVDGNYRVKGSQPFMIGTREYKVIVTGIVRAEDFNDDGISATKLLDAKYDVVSARRKEQE